MVPGSNPQRATELYQEGLVIPPSKLYEAGRPNASLLGIIRANVRDPDIFFGDMRAQEAAFSRAINGSATWSGVTAPMKSVAPWTGHRAYRSAGEGGDPRHPQRRVRFRRFMDHDGIDCPGRSASRSASKSRTRKSSSISPARILRSRGRLTRRWRKPGPRCFIACVASCPTTSHLMTA